MRLAPLICLAAAGVAASGAAVPAFASTGRVEYPSIPEPMVFDMMRPLGAPKGEFEANVLASSRGVRESSWAPEIEYAFADGVAVELELPFEGRRLDEIKLGLQATLGAFNGGRSAHGLQYLGIQDRQRGAHRANLIYMIGHRHNARWSSLSMVGVGDIKLSRATGRNRLILNHATFFTAWPASTVGVEVNFIGGRDGSLLVIPQVHQKLARADTVQFGVGLAKERNQPARPQASVRLIREF